MSLHPGIRVSDDTFILAWPTENIESVWRMKQPESDCTEATNEAE
jgi:putative heme degradation protein